MRDHNQFSYHFDAAGKIVENTDQYIQGLVGLTQSINGLIMQQLDLNRII